MCAVLAKGQAMSGYYRLLGRDGGFLWAFTQATVVHNARASRPHCVVALTYILSYSSLPSLLRPSRSFAHLQFPSNSLP